MLIDSHAHLDDAAFDADRDAVLERARRNDVRRIVTVGTDPTSCEKALAIAEAEDGVVAALGLHPHESDRCAGDDLARLRRLAASPKVVAIGETGLDYAKKFAAVENQQALFRRHLALARELGKPVVIHCRDAHADTRAILREEGIRRGVIHCFSGHADDARDYLALGFHLSIAGPVTFANAHKLRETVRVIPLERLLIETDCPLLAPVPHRGRRNEPSYVLYVAAAVAREHDTTPERVAEITSRNACSLFSI
ncbi:MAG: TatD family hydrolase [Planctomycetes bacterium]|nr:TatD family hydrolase [Planctomycetota bacterium]